MAWLNTLAATAIGLNTLVRYPQTLGWLARLPEHINRYATARIPLAADTQPMGLHFREKTLADANGAVFMKGGVIAE